MHTGRRVLAKYGNWSLLMPFVLIIAGILLFVTAIKGTTGTLAKLVSDDIFGTRGYIYWFASIIIVGAIGYVKPLKGISDAFLLLLILVLFLANRGVFAQFNSALAGTASQDASGNTQQGFGAAIPNLIPVPPIPPLNQPAANSNVQSTPFNYGYM